MSYNLPIPKCHINPNHTVIQVGDTKWAFKCQSCEFEKRATLREFIPDLETRAQLGFN